MKLASICYTPNGTDCAVTSVLQYWQLDRVTYRSGVHPIEYCLSRWGAECLSKYGSPTDPNVVLGGFPVDPDDFTSFTHDTRALATTYLIRADPVTIPHARAWERAFLRLCRERLAPRAAGMGLRLSYSAERSLADEIDRLGRMDNTTLLLSYSAMAIYVALALPVPAIALAFGEHGLAGAAGGRGWSRTAWRMVLRMAVGIGGVLVVVASVASMLGLCGYLGVAVSGLALEVIPFLALAIGVDNMFIVAIELKRQDPILPVEVRMSQALEAAGPSMVLAMTCEGLAFLAGTLSPMPAVRVFAGVAAVVVLFNFILQISALPALLAAHVAYLEGGAGGRRGYGRDGAETGRRGWPWFPRRWCSGGALCPVSWPWPWSRGRRQGGGSSSRDEAPPSRRGWWWVRLDALRPHWDHTRFRLRFGASSGRSALLLDPSTTRTAAPSLSQALLSTTNMSRDYGDVSSLAGDVTLDDLYGSDGDRESDQRPLGGAQDRTDGEAAERGWWGGHRTSGLGVERVIGPQEGNREHHGDGDDDNNVYNSNNNNNDDDDDDDNVPHLSSFLALIPSPKPHGSRSRRCWRAR